MKRETNIAINSQIEIGEYNGFYSGDLLDANATANLIDEKIAAIGAGNALAAVATTGSYNDLTDKPVIPVIPSNISVFTNDMNYATKNFVNSKLNDILGISAQGVTELASILSDNDTTTGILARIAAKADSNSLATVATTGNYNELINKPTIPTVPTNVSDFVNDAGYLTSSDISGLASSADLGLKANSADLATVATSGSYNDLINKPVAQVYYNFTSYDTTGETTYTTGIVKLTGGVVHDKYEVEVLYQADYAELWVGKKFYVTTTAAVGDTLYPLYDINNNAVGVSVKINSAVV